MSHRMFLIETWRIKLLVSHRIFNRTVQPSSMHTFIEMDLNNGIVYIMMNILNRCKPIISFKFTVNLEP